MFSFHSLAMDGFCCALKHVISVCCCCLKFINYMMLDLFNLIIFILVEFLRAAINDAKTNDKVILSKLKTKAASLINEVEDEVCSFLCYEHLVLFFEL